VFFLRNLVSRKNQDAWRKHRRSCFCISPSTLEIVSGIVGRMKTNRQSSKSAFVEILLLFSPALPAYLWLWPNVQGTRWIELAQIITYIYFLGGSLFIGLRRWNLDQLGLNRNGIIMSVLLGLVFILGRTLAYSSTNLPFELQPFSLTRVGGEILFYFLLVGFVEELLFRGLIYRTFKNWRGVPLAIWGSTFMFGIYHIGSQGLLGALGTAIIGLIFAVIRWRADGILGLAFIHGLTDFIAIETQPSMDLTHLSHIQIDEPILLIFSYILLFGPVIYLWKGYHPRNQIEG
jgi:membrane protease YdiL (CAAX protease family)